MQVHPNAGIPANILAVDLGPITIKAIMSGMTIAQAKLGARELRRFYALHAAYPDEPLSPSKLMDELWHHHMLDSIYYRRDCDAMFGHYLDHFPYLGLRGKEDAELLEETFGRTKELYEHAFSEPMPQTFAGALCGGGCVLTVEATDCVTTCGRTMEAAFCVGACAGTINEPAVCAGACANTGDVKCCRNPVSIENLPPRPKLEEYIASMQ